MNFKQAVYQMAVGSRVRLSDWTGYWFLAPDQPLPIKEGETSATYNRLDTDAHLPSIRVFTRDGDILDNPNIERYKDRDDWEVVTETGWSFDMALRFLKNNKEVRRINWDPEFVVFMEYGGLFIDRDKAGTAEIYDPKVQDVMANDWQIVNA